MALTSGTYSGIKSVQRGVFTGTGSGTVAVSAVNTDKSELKLLGFICNGGSVGDNSVHIKLANSTTINVTRTGVATSMSTSWELVEWY